MVTGTDMRSRPAGLAACLADVLVQVSGDPALLHNPRAQALGHEANRLVADFDYADRMSGLKHNDEQGSSDRPYYLTVRFDPAKLRSALGELGDSPYLGSRPTLLPVVLVRGPRQSFVLTSDGYHFIGQPEAFAAAADRYFMPLRLPRAAELADGTVTSTPDLLLISGSLAWSDTAHGWIADWDTDWQGHHAHWGVSGVNYDEASRNAVRGALGVISGHPPSAE